MYGYTICEYEKVKAGFPEFLNTMKSLKTQLIAKASAEWAPKTFGGMSPKAGQFGETTIMPELFFGQQAAQLTTWEQWFGSTGHQTILYGNATGNTIPEDYKLGVAGIALLSKAIRITEIKMQIGDRKIPRINIEEAFAYNKPAVVFEQGLVVDEEEGFDLYAYVQTQGPQLIKLIGLQLNRVPNKLQGTNTGTAL